MIEKQKKKSLLYKIFPLKFISFFLFLNLSLISVEIKGQTYVIFIMIL